MMRHEQLGVAPLSALSLGRVELVETAASAGFANVGIRVTPVRAEVEPLRPGSSELRALRSSVAASGVSVRDIEVLQVGPTTTRETWEPVLEVGGELGASYLNVVGDDPVAARFVDRIAQLTDDAHDHGLVPLLEPIAYRCLNTVPGAFDVAARTGALVELDVLHFLRTRASIDEVVSGQVPILQLCDAPLHSAMDEIEEARSHRLLPGEGEAPLSALADALDPDIYVSMEVPNERSKTLGAGEWLRQLYRAGLQYIDESYRRGEQ